MFIFSIPTPNIQYPVPNTQYLMAKFSKQYLVLCVSLSLVFIPFGTHAWAQNSTNDDNLSAGSMAVDLLFVRPLGIATTALGTTLFIVSLPFSALGRNVKTAAKTLVIEPAKFTFVRPLGEF
jgi:hypothetical protein